MHRALVTGGSGRLGSTLIKLLLEQGVIVHSLDVHPPNNINESSSFTFFLGSVSSLSDVKLAAQGVDIIFHIASRIDLSPSGSLELVQTNVLGTENVIRTCLDLNIQKIIYTSTLDVTWNWKGLSGPETIIYPTNPANGYIKTKGIAEQKILHSNGLKTCKNGTLLTCALRPVHMYGPGDLLAINAVNLAKKGFVPYWPTGQCDFVYLTNAAYAHILCANKLYSQQNHKIGGNVYYIKDDFRTSYLDAIHNFGKIKNPQVKKIHFWFIIIALIGLLFTFIYSIIFRLGFHPDYPFSYWHVQLITQNENVDNSRSINELGYYQLVSTAQGLRETEEWIKRLK